MFFSLGNFFFSLSIKISIVARYCRDILLLLLETLLKVRECIFIYIYFLLLL